MSLQDWVNAQVKAARAKAFEASDQLSLGQLIDLCEAIPLREDDPQKVVFAFCDAVPTGIDSWRGAYSELALSWDMDGEAMTLDRFTAMLKWAVGQTCYGYKGGEYRMTRDTPLWVSNYGRGDHTTVTGLLDEGWRVVILTGYREE